MRVIVHFITQIQQMSKVVSCDASDPAALLLSDPRSSSRQKSHGLHVLPARPQLPGWCHPREGQEEEGGREEEKEEARQHRQRRWRCKGLEWTDFHLFYVTGVRLTSYLLPVFFAAACTLFRFAISKSTDIFQCTSFSCCGLVPASFSVDSAHSDLWRSADIWQS